MKTTMSTGKKTLNALLLISFLVTIAAPLTGIVIHKLASALFLLLCIVHTVLYRRKLNWQRWAVLGLVLLSFVSGVFGMILDYIPMVLSAHKVISIAVVFFLAIHIFVFHRRMK